MKETLYLGITLEQENSDNSIANAFDTYYNKINFKNFENKEIHIEILHCLIKYLESKQDYENCIKHLNYINKLKAS